MRGWRPPLRAASARLVASFRAYRVGRLPAASGWFAARPRSMLSAALRVCAVASPKNTGAPAQRSDAPSLGHIPTEVGRVEGRKRDPLGSDPRDAHGIGTIRRALDRLHGRIPQAGPCSTLRRSLFRPTTRAASDRLVASFRAYRIGRLPASTVASPLNWGPCSSFQRATSSLSP